jgi:D-amino-acid oxidase
MFYRDEKGGGQVVHTIRGQIVRLRPNDFPGIELDGNRISVLIDADEADEMAYIVPRFDDIVLGGTYTKVLHGEEELSKVPDRGTRDAILSRCAALLDRFGQTAWAHDHLRYDTSALEDACGLRPWRKRIRVERESLPDGRPLIHNYGHGGAGVTLSWGCAAEVLHLLGESSRP